VLIPWAQKTVKISYGDMLMVGGFALYFAMGIVLLATCRRITKKP
jgi:hypothetical protein